MTAHASSVAPARPRTGKRKRDRPGAGPPRPRFVLTVGITGHRSNRLTPEREIAARARTEAMLAMIEGQAQRLLADGGRWYAPGAPEFRLISALAEGADRLAAELALERHWRLDVALPFSRATYIEDFETEASVARFDALMGRAANRLELPGERAAADAAYSLAGGAIIAAADILVAIWNGEGSGGRGGTGDVVATALGLGKPVIHIPLEADQPVRLLWEGEGAAGTWHSPLEMPGVPCVPERVAEALAPIVLPPPEPLEQQALADFLDEREERLVRRIEYPILLAVTGTQPLKPGAWRKSPYAEATRSDWQRFDAITGDKVAADRRAALEDSYAWADNLANRFAQFFRSGHVMNFAFSAIAVAMALLGYLIGGKVKVLFVVGELLLIGAIVANTRVGHAEAWHQRWLDYRQLAERLRPMRSLKLLAVARAPSTGAASRTGNRRWLDWYAGALWRQLGMPAGRIGPGEARQLADLVQREELAPEISYHHRNAQRMAHVNHRLHQFGSACFLLTVFLCLAFLVLSFALDPATAKKVAVFFTVATAALPAFGTAAYGLRVQGDFVGSAARSVETSDALADLARDLAASSGLAHTAAIANAAATVMLVDLAEWRLTYQQRALEIPG